jgi:hypothetical protein
MPTLVKVRAFRRQPIPFIEGLIIVTTLAACHADRGSSVVSTRTGGSPDVLPVVNAIGVQGRLTATVEAREPFICTYTHDSGLWEGPCRRFTIINPGAGTLVATLSWENQQPMTLSVKTLDGENRGVRCCRSPQTLKISVGTGSVYEVQVTLLQPWGGDARQKFDLLVSLEP